MSTSQSQSEKAQDRTARNPGHSRPISTTLAAAEELPLEGLSSEQRQAVLTWLDHHVPKPRLSHILRVEEMAIALAQQHGLSAAKAAQAGLMHDLAKYFPPDQLLTMAADEGIEIDPVFEITPHLLHADVSAVVARREFGVTDPDILGAIANHTLGSPGMSELSQIVFLADSLEPGRGTHPTLETLRQISTQDLEEAVWKTCDYTFEHLIQTQKLIHPRALMTRNWFLQSTKSRPAS